MRTCRCSRVNLLWQATSQSAPVNRESDVYRSQQPAEKVACHQSTTRPMHQSLSFPCRPPSLWTMGPGCACLRRGAPSCVHASSGTLSRGSLCRCAFARHASVAQGIGFRHICAPCWTCITGTGRLFLIRTPLARQCLCRSSTLSTPASMRWVSCSALAGIYASSMHMAV